MSNYTDDYFDQQRDAAMQMQAEWERTDTKECGWHRLHFPNESPLMERGGSRRITTGMCCNCAAIENDKVDALLARARVEARYSDFESYLEDEGRPNPYSGIDEWSESV